MTPETLAEIHQRAFADQRGWRAHEFSELLSSDHVFLTTTENAFALGRVIADEAELLTLATDPGARRQGQARTCLKRFEDMARTRGATRTFLEVSAENTAAHRLYKTCGYILIARRSTYYSYQDGRHSDALIMEKRIGN
ncbi:GNAT family N-acetyltransferase [Aquicoccus sp.]|uniref:GNAT family N-acetyltransferase n=1 Tax=Aquicoccus sp. TaxID=2055851 RepID=UPI0035637980